MRIQKRCFRLPATFVFSAVAIFAACGIGESLAQTGAPQYVQAQPRTLLEALFPGLAVQRGRRYVDPRFQPRFERRMQRNGFWGAQDEPFPEHVEAPRVSAPQYYTYKPARLVEIDLVSLEPSTGSVEQAPIEPASLEMRDSSEVVVDTVASATPYERIAGYFGLVTVMAEPDIAKAIVAHYKISPVTLWLDENLQPNAKARSVLPLLADAGRYGLDPTDYAVGLPSGNTAEEAARFEIAMTARAVRYGMDAAYGRINANLLSGYHDFPRKSDMAATTLAKIAEGGLPARTLEAMHPDNAPFRALMAELGRVENETTDLIVIPSRTFIRPGDVHEEVPNIIAALAKRGSVQLSAQAAAIVLPADSGNLYSSEVVDLVKSFQAENHLVADGVIGPNTVSKLTDVDAGTKRERILLAMERLRWHPHKLGSTYVFINQPAYRARFVRDNKSVLDMRVVVGQKTNQTSFFYDQIETVEYNPYWGVPQSILVNEYLPKLRENPAYLDERNYEITDRSGRQIASSMVDWYMIGNEVPFDVRQRPGPSNALGELKILFPNKHAIYMHDTPAKNLFERSTRAFSHGCVRLQHPREMAAAVLGKSVDYVAQQIAQGHSSEVVKNQIPVYVAYFTAWPADDGTIEYFADSYSRDEHLLDAIELTRGAREVTS
jgi:L,D-transpeptidase YcbB